MQSAAAAWSGIAVRTGVADGLLSLIRVGDLLVINGTVVELAGMTALQNVTAYEIMSRGNIVTAIQLKTGDLGTACSAAGEAYEGLLVTMQNAEVVSSAGACDAMINDGSSETLLSIGTGAQVMSITGIVYYLDSRY
eukprot:CAMPEP_0206173260 /NCGR_PEP_ID=MMETSP1474-20131121/48284_1 /ASSEMBLY_ACC=CAM_ASM_001110 /TAXON_ID=97495 /ORGANISM="Imantonia sp., Strain RCC918" /LENGTH=136 /DNA_ID=CAMNT_0053581947 /DNA_START=68 /DNA_END=475 /DNA_ORIENTATION=+